ncbi:hypothetical protein BGZ96_001982, partial [Linnemannia gamsii]
WPTIEREAKDQIREKKIRCAFLPPLGHEISQIKEEELESTPSPSAHITFSDSTNNINSSTVPASPVRQTAQQPLAVSAVHSTTTSSSADVGTLKRDLESAQETIHSLQSSVERLQREATSLRQRKPETGSSSAPTMTAVHLKNNQQEGYPVTYVAGAAVVAFLFAYLFF